MDMVTCNVVIMEALSCKYYYKIGN